MGAGAQSYGFAAYKHASSGLPGYRKERKMQKLGQFVVKFLKARVNVLNAGAVRNTPRSKSVIPPNTQITASAKLAAAVASTAGRQAWLAPLMASVKPR